MSIKTKIMAVLCACLMGMSAPAHAAEKNDPIRIGLITWAGHGMVYVGIEKGFFGDLKVEPSVLDDANARNAAWMSGKLEFVVQTIDAMPIEYAQGLTGKIMFVQDASNGADGIIAKKEIAGVKDLKGKTVSFARGNPSHFLLYQALQANGLNLSDVKTLVTDDAGTAAQAFISGQVDAAVTYEPYMTKALQAQKSSAHLIATTRDYPQDIVDAMRVSDDFLAKHPDTVKAFIAGWLKSIDYAEKHPKESAAIIAKGLGVAPADMEENMRGMKLSGTDMNAEYLCGDAPKFASLYDRATALWLQEKIIDKAPIAGKNVISPIGCELFNAEAK